MRFSNWAAAGLFMVSCGALPTLANAASDPTTGFPLYPGSKLVETQPPGVRCGITIRGVQYESDDSASKAIAFFHNALLGARAWTAPAARTSGFLSPSGKTMVKVLDVGPAGIYIIYGAFSKPLTVAQIRSGKC